jgi:plasmid stability protein
MAYISGIVSETSTMDEITITLEREMVAVLERRASQSGRSLSDEISTIVRNDITGRTRPADPVEWARRIRAMTPPGAKQTPAVQLIREDRDRDE